MPDLAIARRLARVGQAVFILAALAVLAGLRPAGSEFVLGFTATYACYGMLWLRGLARVGLLRRSPDEIYERFRLAGLPPFFVVDTLGLLMGGLALSLLR